MATNRGSQNNVRCLKEKDPFEEAVEKLREYNEGFEFYPKDECEC
mgnify:CR=1 FL=1